MKLIKSSEGETYEAQLHYNCWTARKITPDMGSKHLGISYSHFLPNGGADMSSAPVDRVYYLISGALEIKGKDEIFTLQPGDMLYIPAEEERAVSVIGNQPATMLVMAAM